MVEDMGNLSQAISAGAEKPGCLPGCYTDTISGPNYWLVHAEGCPNDTPLDHVADAQRYGTYPKSPPRQGLWQNLRAAFAYILFAWALDIMPEPTSTILARGMMSVREELDAYEKQNRGRK